MANQSGSKISQLKTRHGIWIFASAIILVNFLSCQISVGLAAEMVATTVVGVGVGAGAKPEFLIRATANNKSASAEELKLSPRLDCSITYPYCCSSANPCPDYYDYCDVNKECQSCDYNEEWDGQKCVYCSYFDDGYWNGTACISCPFPDSWSYTNNVCKNKTDNTWMIYTFIPLGLFVLMFLGLLPACCLRCRCCPMYREGQDQDLVVTSVHTISTVPSGGAPWAVPEPAGVIIGQSRFGHDAFGNPVMLASRHIVMDAPAPAQVHHQDPRQMAGRDLPPPYYPPTAQGGNNNYF